MSCSALILIADLLLVVKRPHVPSMKESTLWVVFYVTLALVFAGLMFLISGGELAGQFLAGWLTEYSLSIDNLFVFVIIMARFSVPKSPAGSADGGHHHRAHLPRHLHPARRAAHRELQLGLLPLRRVPALHRLEAGVRPQRGCRGRRDGAHPLHRSATSASRRSSTTSKLRTVIDGKKVFTPMLIVFIAIGTTDLMFALDSIPAIFGITQSPFIVFTANIFALMGLRQLYFLLGGLLERLDYLKYGIAFILAFIGVKLVLHAMHENELPFINSGQHIEWAPEIDTWTSLAVIIAVDGRRHRREPRQVQPRRACEGIRLRRLIDVSARLSAPCSGPSAGERGALMLFWDRAVQAAS